MHQHHRPHYHQEETELDPRLITYSSDEDMDDDDFEDGDVDLLGYGGYGGSESQHFRSNGRSPSEGSQSFGLIRKFDLNHSVASTGPLRRLSTTTSDPLSVQRVYDPLYSQHTKTDDYQEDTLTSRPSSPRQETVYIPSASVVAPQRVVRRERQADNVLSDSDDDADTALEMGRRRRHHES